MEMSFSSSTGLQLELFLLVPQRDPLQSSSCSPDDAPSFLPCVTCFGFFFPVVTADYSALLVSAALGVPAPLSWLLSISPRLHSGDLVACLCHMYILYSSG